MGFAPLGGITGLSLSLAKTIVLGWASIDSLSDLEDSLIFGVSDSLEPKQIEETSSRGMLWASSHNLLP